MENSILVLNDRTRMITITKITAMITTITTTTAVAIIVEIIKGNQQ